MEKHNISINNHLLQESSSFKRRGFFLLEIGKKYSILDIFIFLKKNEMPVFADIVPSLNDLNGSI
ncbi:hypothetical protein J5751_03175 [bacterium]|nr:hypothetical protein [bacterium]